MKLLFDQNISYRILKHLSTHFAGSTTVKVENLIDTYEEYQRRISFEKAIIFGYYTKK